MGTGIENGRQLAEALRELADALDSDQVIEVSYRLDNELVEGEPAPDEDGTPWKTFKMTGKRSLELRWMDLRKRDVGKDDDPVVARIHEAARWLSISEIMRALVAAGWYTSFTDSGAVVLNPIDECGGLALSESWVCVSPGIQPKGLLWIYPDESAINILNEARGIPDVAITVPDLKDEQIDAIEAAVAAMEERNGHVVA